MNGKLTTVVLIFGVLLCCAAVALSIPSSATAGPIFLPGKLRGDTFIPSTADETCSYSIRYSTITTVVDGRQAETKLQETVAGPSTPMDVVCLIPLPAGTLPNTATLSSGPRGEAAETSPGTRFLSADEAQAVYESIAQGLDRVELLTLTGRPALLVPEFRLAGTIELTVGFRQTVEDLDGVASLRLPTPATRCSTGPVARLSPTVTVRDQQPLRAMFSPTHDASIIRETLHQVTARIKADNWSGDDDLQLCWVADQDDLGLRVLAYRDGADDDGYFMLFGNPTGQATGDQIIAKDVVFVLDTSGSMRGEKIEQARAAIEYCLGHLNEGDRFNIVTFGTRVNSFSDSLEARSPKKLASAQDFIEDVVAQGRTNISGAIARSLDGQPAKGRPHITIFLTDGTPTAGEVVPEKIIAAVKDRQPCPTRFFVMGVGHDVNTHLLDKLAEATDGSSEYVTADDDIDATIAALYDRLSHPVLTQVAVDCGSLRTHSMYPRKFPALFKGNDFMLFGRYRKGGLQTFTVSGQLAGRTTQYTCQADLPAVSSGDGTAFVGPLWAARKIGYLLQEIRLHGEDEELIAEVVRLSKQFGIVTEYTEFLASTSGEVSTEEAVREAQRRMNMANAVQAGQWAFNQARNDLQLQQKVVSGQAANFYLDRRGRKVATENIQQLRDSVFYLRDGQWVDAREQGERKTRPVELFSDEYHELVRNNPRFAQAQRLGWAVSINVGDERIVIEKDGVAQSEELLERSRQQQAVEPQQMQNSPLNQQFNNQLRQNQLPLNQLRNNQFNQQQEIEQQ